MRVGCWCKFVVKNQLMLMDSGSWTNCSLEMREHMLVEVAQHVTAGSRMRGSYGTTLSSLFGGPWFDVCFVVVVWCVVEGSGRGGMH